MNNRFYLAGISYRKSDIDFRSRFAFNAQHCMDAYTATDRNTLEHFFILSTCNRTEVYGFAPCEYVLPAILQTRVEPGYDLTNDIYMKEGDAAIEHLFRVAAGLDSQIPGDYEVISQIKSSFQLARNHGRVNGFMEKIINFALEASKEIKNTTSFSDGTLSVPWSVATEIASHSNINHVTIVGAGETATLTVKYLQKLREDICMIVVNRGDEKLKMFEGQPNISVRSLSNLYEALVSSQALVVATNSETPLVHLRHLEHSNIRFVYDLSVPKNVGEDVYNSDRYEVMDVDAISKCIQSTSEQRRNEIPKAEAIVTHFVTGFREWQQRHQYFSLADQMHRALPFKLSKNELYQNFIMWKESNNLDDHEAIHRSMMESLNIRLQREPNSHAKE